MKRILLLIALLLSVVGPAVAVPAESRADTGATLPPARDVPLRVVSYNIHAGIGADGVFNLDRQVAAIDAMDADVVALQEVDVYWSGRSQWRDMATELAEALEMFAFFAPIYSLAPRDEGWPRREYGLAILSRHPILHAENHHITRLSTQNPNPTPTLEPGFPEVVVNVRGARVHVYATHLDYRSAPYVREMQVADMREIMDADRGEQQVLVGDFNATPGAAELDPLWKYLADAWRTVNGDTGGETYSTSNPFKRIDYVTASSGIDIVACEVPMTRASDHLPVVADLMAVRGL